MKESYYQSKIIKAIESRGGHVINGQYTRAGEADLQCGYPVVIRVPRPISEQNMGGVLPYIDTTTLRYLAVEVKTEEDYARVMKCINIITVDGVEQYQIIGDCKGLKKHEPLQITKINSVRRKGGLALIAWSFQQVEQYVKSNT